MFLTCRDDDSASPFLSPPEYATDIPTLRRAALIRAAPARQRLYDDGLPTPESLLKLRRARDGEDECRAVLSALLFAASCAGELRAGRARSFSPLRRPSPAIIGLGASAISPQPD